MIALIIQKHSSKTLLQRVPANSEIVIVSNSKGLSQWGFHKPEKPVSEIPVHLSLFPADVSLSSKSIS